MVPIPIPSAGASPPITGNHNPVIANTGFSIPEKKPFLVSDDTRRLLEIVDKHRARGENTNILISGNQGTGKSELCEQFAATRQAVFSVTEVGILSDPSQIFGTTELINGETKYIPGLFTRAITTPGMVVHLQELNRPENDKSLNALFSVLDPKQRRIWVDEMQQFIHVAPGVTFFATLNEGFQFVGTLPLDSALRDRFNIKIQLGMLPDHQEQRLLVQNGGLAPELATQLLTMVKSLRANTQTPIEFSTRDLMNVAELLTDELDLFLALKSVMGGNDDIMETIFLSQHVTSGHSGRSSSADNYSYL